MYADTIVDNAPCSAANNSKIIISIVIFSLARPTSLSTVSCYHRLKQGELGVFQLKWKSQNTSTDAHSPSWASIRGCLKENPHRRYNRRWKRITSKSESNQSEYECAPREVDEKLDLLTVGGHGKTEFCRGSEAAPSD